MDQKVLIIEYQIRNQRFMEKIEKIKFILAQFDQMINDFFFINKL